MTEVESNTRRRMPSSSASENKTTRSGDWSIEEVDGRGADINPAPKERPRFKFSNPTNEESFDPAAPKKTTEGNWSIEETE